MVFLFLYFEIVLVFSLLSGIGLRLGLRLFPAPLLVFLALAGLFFRFFAGFGLLLGFRFGLCRLAGQPLGFFVFALRLRLRLLAFELRFASDLLVVFVDFNHAVFYEKFRALARRIENRTQSVDGFPRGVIVFRAGSFELF